ncbi:hypothetical protein DUNSADRAFT_8846 [Dunaliella salina]|uniref:Encoded protein n=1 Tax=Dunaliella salina TaxID=3046 RepID=A0ABQ7H5M8_DUNSA|nr:hypothetical protein DUNSADRAFT_8846 [Dunaliella salina]|eukprot:KAF5842159.1 hypothetical protein DUNSADRAFT_8846 [Dunaliella salina]
MECSILLHAQARTAVLESQHRHMVRICLHCGGGGGPGEGSRCSLGGAVNRHGNGGPGERRPPSGQPPSPAPAAAPAPPAAAPLAAAHAPPAAAPAPAAAALPAAEAGAAAATEPKLPPSTTTTAKATAPAAAGGGAAALAAPAVGMPAAASEGAPANTSGDDGGGGCGAGAHAGHHVRGDGAGGLGHATTHVEDIENAGQRPCAAAAVQGPGSGNVGNNPQGPVAQRPGPSIIGNMHPRNSEQVPRGNASRTAGGVALNPAYVAACREGAPPGAPQPPKGCTWGGAHAVGVGGFMAASLHGDGGVVCDSLDCGVYFERRKVQQELATSGALLQAVERVLCSEVEGNKRKRKH